MQSHAGTTVNAVRFLILDVSHNSSGSAKFLTFSLSVWKRRSQGAETDNYNKSFFIGAATKVLLAAVAGCQCYETANSVYCHGTTR